MKNDKTRLFFRSIGKKFIAVALIIFGLTFLTDLSIRPIIESVNAYECHLAVSEIINKAVGEELANEEINYSKLVNLTTNSDGEVISVESNVNNINCLKTNISKRMDKELDSFKDLDILIPIGTLTGIQLLHGKGFDVGMTVSPLGYAKTEIISEFKNAGLNQTQHRILIEISVSADAIIPGFSTDVNVTTSIVAAETIIVGRVPDAYTHVISYDDDIMGALQDYGAAV